MAGMADPTPSPTRPRVLIFIVAYEAETTLHQVLARIPDGIFRDFDAEVLVIDDFSAAGFAGSVGHALSMLTMFAAEVEQTAH